MDYKEFPKVHELSAAEIMEIIRDLTAERDKYKEALQRINHRASSYTNREVPAIVLDEVREISGLATNPFIAQSSLKEEPKE
jgi:hypothetical protein